MGVWQRSTLDYISTNAAWRERTRRSRQEKHTLKYDSWHPCLAKRKARLEADGDSEGARMHNIQPPYHETSTFNPPLLQEHAAKRSEILTIRACRSINRCDERGARDPPWPLFIPQSPLISSCGGSSPPCASNQTRGAGLQQSNRCGLATNPAAEYQNASHTWPGACNFSKTCQTHREQQQGA